MKCVERPPDEKKHDRTKFLARTCCVLKGIVYTIEAKPFNLGSISCSEYLACIFLFLMSTNRYGVLALPPLVEIIQQSQQRPLDHSLAQLIIGEATGEI